ncbi:ATP-grasp domain-containing protein [bacterium]|jgi:carbamoyl-phosphate synthase large subunit|nr:ATP-grasp domain-containing protein [bacterium]
MSKKIKVLVTAVGAPPGRNTVRALRNKKEISVIAADADSLVPVLYNKNEVLNSYVIPPAREEEKYIRALRKITEKENIQVIMPCIEEEINVLSRYRKYFHRMGADIICADYEKICKLSDKKSMVSQALKVGVPVPDTFSVDDISKTNKTLRFPLIIKPRRGHGARNIYIIKSRNDIAKIPPEYIAGKRNFIVQEYIPGGTGSIFLCGLLYGIDNVIKAEFLSRSIKTLYEFGGPAVCGEPVNGFRRIKDYTKKLISGAGGWYGPVNVEYKISSENGIPYLIEVNPRFWGYGYLAVGSGVNFPYLAVLESAGKKVKPVTKYRTDKVLLRETMDTVISRGRLKLSGGDKIIFVCNIGKKCDVKAEKLKKHIRQICSDVFVFTGKEEYLKSLVFISGWKDNIHFYINQTGDWEENINEIGLCYFADLIVYFDLSDLHKALCGIERRITLFLKKKLQRFYSSGSSLRIIRTRRFRDEGDRR